MSKTNESIDASTTRDHRGWSAHLQDDFDSAELLAELTKGTLPAELEALAARNPTKSIIELDESVLQAEELASRSRVVAVNLQRRGLSASDTIIIAVPASEDFVTAYLGCLRLGATVVLVDPAMTDREIDHLVKSSASAAAIVVPELEDSFNVFVTAETSLRSILKVDELFSEVRQSRTPPLPLDPDAVALLAYTSGTTGQPKAVPLTHANLLSSVRAAMWAWRWSSSDVLLHALPLYHQHGLSGLHFALLSGSLTIVQSGFNEEHFLRTIESRGATVLFGVPAIYRRLAQFENASEVDLSSLRLIVSGSAPLPPVLASQVRALTGLDPLERYGTTESGLNVSNLYDGPRKPGTVGLPLPGIELAIARGEETGADVETGEILLRGPQVFTGYRGGSQSELEDGWFRTGDLGRIDPMNGTLEITGRAKELIITGGVNVSPVEVERILEESTDVSAACVVGVPSDKWGEELVAFVTPTGPEHPTAESIISAVRKELSKYKSPKRVYFLQSLPRNQMGKLRRAWVRELGVALRTWENSALHATRRISGGRLDERKMQS